MIGLCLLFIFINVVISMVTLALVYAFLTTWIEYGARKKQGGV